MKQRKLLCTLLLFLDAGLLTAEPTLTATAAFNTYTQTVESRLAQQHRSPTTFLIPAILTPNNAIILEHLPTPATADGTLLHHWRGTAFAPGATPSDFLRLMRDFNSYPQHFAPQVLQAKILTQTSDRMTASMRIRQRHVITVVMDTTYDITFGQLDPAHGYSISQSTHIAELDSTQHPLNPADEHGFLYRLNTYWSYEQRDGGLYLQIEAVSLTRSIPRGLAWAIRPYIESIPRESLEFTLRSACNAISK